MLQPRGLVGSVQLPGQYAFSSPPTAEGGFVYVGGAGDGGTVYAVDEKNGAVVWTENVEMATTVRRPWRRMVYSCPTPVAGLRFRAKKRRLPLAFIRVVRGRGRQDACFSRRKLYVRDPLSSPTAIFSNQRAVHCWARFSAGPAPQSPTTRVFLNDGTLQG